MTVPHPYDCEQARLRLGYDDREALQERLDRLDRLAEMAPRPFNDFPRPPCAGPSSGANENTGQGGPGR